MKLIYSPFLPFLGIQQTQLSKATTMTFKTIWIRWILLWILVCVGPYWSIATTESTSERLQNKIYLPLQANNILTRDIASNPSIFGVEAGGYRVEQQLYRSAETQAHWLRNNVFAIEWSEVEKTEGKRDWNTQSIRDVERHMMLANQYGFQLIQIVRGTPQWARKYPGKGASCGPIEQQKYRAFASFMRDVVTRYSAPPFNVKYWEIWNEPDAPALMGDNAQEVFGCWGEIGVDPYYSYGGRHFGFMLQNVYPAVKAADPESKVILGGLLLSCHPTFEKANDSICSKLSAGFLEGVFIGGGGDSFDILGIHAYDIWFGGTSYKNEQWYSGSDSIGPSLAAKTDYVRGVLTKYGYANKPIMNTEYALICWQCKTPPPEFEATKANYVAQANVIAMAKGLLANIWYSVEGWGTHQTQLLHLNGQTTPAYNALSVAVDRLGPATFSQIEPSAENVRIYAFQRVERKLWVAWSSTNEKVVINLPEMPNIVMDAVGNRIEASQTVTVTANPLYIEFLPPTPPPPPEPPPPDPPPLPEPPLPDAPPQ